MIQVIVVSKDRASQLDLMLCTLKKYFKEWQEQTYDILYMYTSDFYKEGYDRVMKLHPEPQFNWIKETNFRDDMIRIFNTRQESLVSFLVDDDIFIDDLTLDCPEFKEFLKNPLVACLSCRMAPYINFCYTANIPTPPPDFSSERLWSWHQKGLAGDWNYVCSIASFHIFRRSDLVFSVNNLAYKAPNTFEAALASRPPNNRPLMICFERAKCFVGVNNRCQTENGNRTTNTDPVDIMNRIFLEGHRLSADANHQLQAFTAHGPVQYLWRKSE